MVFLGGCEAFRDPVSRKTLFKPGPQSRTCLLETYRLATNCIQSGGEPLHCFDTRDPIRWTVIAQNRMKIIGAGLDRDGPVLKERALRPSLGTADQFSIVD